MERILLIMAAAFAGVAVLGALVYGIFRRFTRVSWLSWQILIVFSATLLLGVVDLPATGWVCFAVVGGALFGVSALVLAVGGGARFGMLAHAGSPPVFIAVCNRLLGGITALLNAAVGIVCVAAPVLAALPFFGVQPAVLAPLYENAAWQAFAGRAFDLLLVAVCMLLVRAGYRIGLVRSLWTVLMLALALGAVVLSAFLALRVPFLRSFAGTIAGTFGQMNAAAAQVLGTVIVALICFAVFLVIIILIGLLVNLLVKKLRGPLVLGVIDGVLMAVVFGALFFVLVCGVNTGVWFLASGMLTDAAASASESLLDVAEQVTRVGQTIRSFLTASPLSAILYTGNPLLLVLPAA